MSVRIGVEPKSSKRGWPAHLELAFQRSGEHCVVRRVRQEGPLLIQRPFYPEGPEAPHVYVISPPGGVVGGDRLDFLARIEQGAHGVVTTPAATKVYRSGGDAASLSQRFDVGEEAVLEWLPQETIAFDGAEVTVSTRVDLARTACFLGWEILCLGRPAARETFQRGVYRQRFEIHREGRALLVDRARFEGGGPVLGEAWGLGGRPVTACLVCASRRPEVASEAVAALRAPAAEMASGPAPRAHFATSAVGELVVCRYLGESAEEARALLGRAWSILRPLAFGRAACAPRVWAT